MNGTITNQSEIETCPFCKRENTVTSQTPNQYGITTHYCNGCYKSFKTNSEGTVIIVNGKHYKVDFDDIVSYKLNSVVSNLEAMKEEMQSQARSIEFMLKTYNAVLDDEGKKQLTISLKKAKQMIKSHEELSEKTYNRWNEAWNKEGQPY